MEHLIYFQKLIAKLNSKYTVDSINHFIKEYYADILEEQYAMDKVAEKIVNREEFLKRYFEPEFFIDERTYRRWRKKELKNVSRTIMSQTDQMFLRTCYDLRGTRLLQIIDFILPILKEKDDMPIEEYLAEFKRAVWEYEVYQEYLDGHEFDDDLPRYSFNRKSSSILLPYKKLIKKKRGDYILENKKQPNIMAEILGQNHFQIALKNEK